MKRRTAQFNWFANPEKQGGDREVRAADAKSYRTTRIFSIAPPPLCSATNGHSARTLINRAGKKLARTPIDCFHLRFGRTHKGVTASCQLLQAIEYSRLRHHD